MTSRFFFCCSSPPFFAFCRANSTRDIRGLAVFENFEALASWNGPCGEDLSTVTAFFVDKLNLGLKILPAAFVDWVVGTIERELDSELSLDLGFESNVVNIGAGIGATDGASRSSSSSSNDAVELSFPVWGAFPFQEDLGDSDTET